MTIEICPLSHYAKRLVMVDTSLVMNHHLVRFIELK